MKRKLLVDTDAGTDDAMALIMLLTDPTVEVVAITTVRGNTDALQIARNVLRILKVANALQVPVYPGTDTSILGDCPVSHYYHGKDGLGDCPDPDAPPLSMLQQEGAVDAIIKLTHEHSGELTLMWLGPLTNLALALQRDKDLASRVAGCYVMGGNTQGRGNITVSAEFNFFADPEAAYIVLHNYKELITLLTWETCLQNPIPWDVFHGLVSSPSPLAAFMQTIHKKILATYYQNSPGFVMADQLAAASFLDSACVTDSEEVYATVELKGEFTRGQMVVDWRNMWKKEPNIRLIKSVDFNLIMDMLKKTLSS